MWIRGLPILRVREHRPPRNTRRTSATGRVMGKEVSASDHFDTRRQGIPELRVREPRPPCDTRRTSATGRAPGKRVASPQRLHIATPRVHCRHHPSSGQRGHRLPPLTRRTSAAGRALGCGLKPLCLHPSPRRPDTVSITSGASRSDHHCIGAISASRAIHSRLHYHAAGASWLAAEPPCPAGPLSQPRSIAS